MSFDNTCKYLAEQYPQAYVNWLLPNATEVVEVLKTELPAIQDAIKKITRTETPILYENNRRFHRHLRQLISASCCIRVSGLFSEMSGSPGVVVISLYYELLKEFYGKLFRLQTLYF